MAFQNHGGGSANRSGSICWEDIGGIFNDRNGERIALLDKEFLTVQELRRLEEIDIELFGNVDVKELAQVKQELGGSFSPLLSLFIVVDELKRGDFRETKSAAMTVRYYQNERWILLTTAEKRLIRESFEFYNAQDKACSWVRFSDLAQKPCVESGFQRLLYRLGKKIAEKASRLAIGIPIFEISEVKGELKFRFNCIPYNYRYLPKDSLA